MAINVILLSIIEGITEFLPISSTGHLIIVSEWLKMDPDFAKVFDVTIQLGAILAVVFLYPRYFKERCRWQFFTSHDFKVIVAAIVPALVLGYCFHGTIKAVLFTSKTVFLGLIVGGFGLILADMFLVKLGDRADQKESVSIRQAVIIGLFQCASLWPGMSRSGSTIIGGLIAKTNLVTAASFSFIIAVPVIIAAVGYDLIQSYHFLSLHQLGWIIMGMMISFFVAYGSMKWFLRFIQHQGLLIFGIYRIVLGGVGLVLFG